MSDARNVRLIESRAEFAALRDPWVTLVRASGGALPFDSHRWLSAWWTAVEETRRPVAPAIATVWEGGRIVAALPLERETGRFRRLPVRRLRLMGGGWGSGALRVADDASHGTVEALGELVRPLLARADLAQLGPMRAGPAAAAALASHLTGANPAASPVTLRQPYLALRPTWEEFLRGQSRNFRRTVKRKLQAVGEAGLVSTRHRAPAAEQMLPLLTAVTATSWQGTQGVAVTASAFGRAFYAALLRSPGEFEVDLLALHHDGEPVAFLVGLVADGIYHAFETGFDPRWSECSPGLALHFLILEQLHAEGVRELDFGFAHGYKERFDPEFRDLTMVSVERSALLRVWRRTTDLLMRARPAAATAHAAAATAEEEA